MSAGPIINEGRKRRLDNAPYERRISVSMLAVSYSMSTRFS